MGLSQHVDDPQPIQVSSCLLHWVPWCRPTPTTSPPLIPLVVMGLSQHVDDPLPIQVSSCLLHWVPWCRPTPTTSPPSFHGSSWDWVNTWTTPSPYRSVVVSYTECSGAGLPLRHPPPHSTGRHGTESTRGRPPAHTGQWSRPWYIIVYNISTIQTKQCKPWPLFQSHNNSCYKCLIPLYNNHRVSLPFRRRSSALCWTSNAPISTTGMTTSSCSPTTSSRSWPIYSSRPTTMPEWPQATPEWQQATPEWTPSGGLLLGL